MDIIQQYNDTEQSKKIIKDNIKSLNDDVSSLFRKGDIQNYLNYYGFYDRSKYDYIRKYNSRELPAIPKKVNLQQNAVNILMSERVLRHIPGAPRIYDSEISKERYNQIIHKKIDLLLKSHRANYYKYTASIEKLKMQLQEVKNRVNKEPQSEQEAEQIKMMQLQLPELEMQYSQMFDALNDEKFLSEKEVERFERFFKYDYKDYFQILAEKIKKKVIDETFFKETEKKAFKSKLITGKPIYLVFSEENKKNVTIKHLNENNVSWPKFSGIEWIQKGPWASYSEVISFDSTMLHYGDELEREYGDNAIKALQNFSNNNSGSNSLMLSLPDGGSIFMNELDSSQVFQETYSGSFQPSYGVLKEIIYYKANRKVYIKVSPNKYDSKKPFEHYVNPYKRLINKDEYNYDKKYGIYVSKKDKSRFFNKKDVEVFSKKKGEDQIVKYITDIYKGVILNHEYIVDAKLHDRVVENPDDYGDVNLPIFGKAFSDETDQPTSPMTMTNDLQEMYDTLSLHREIMIAISGAAGIVIDKSQQPDMEDEEWEYHMKMGRLYIETTDSMGKQKSQFNQWKNYDNSLGQGVMYIDNIMRGIQELIGIIVGVPRQRIGELTNSDQVGTYNQSIKQASLITQILHYDMDELNSKVLEEAINLFVKYHLQYYDDIIDINSNDAGVDQIHLNIKKVTRYYFKVYLDRKSSDTGNMDNIKEFALQSSLSGNGPLDLSDVAELFNKDSLRELMDSYSDIVSKKREIAQQSQSQAAQQEFNQDKQLKELEGKLQMQLEDINNKMEEKKLQFDQFKLNAEQELENKKLAIESKLKLFELVNEQKSEEEVVMNNDKHATNQEQIKLLEIKINALLNSDKTDKDFKLGLDKNDKDYKAKKLVKEHVSDK